jgi:hypothetical protein
MASTRSRVWNASDSSAARTTWARVVPRVSPNRAPRTSGRQYGAPRPTKAGTITTPPVSRTRRAIASLSPALAITWSPSRNHCIAAPAMNTLPSRA